MIFLSPVGDEDHQLTAFEQTDYKDDAAVFEDEPEDDDDDEPSIVEESDEKAEELGNYHSCM